jgi:Fibronectin type III domain
MRLRQGILAGLLSVSIISCSGGNDTTKNGDTNPPATPSGFSVTAKDSSINSTWVANPESDLNHYDIYLGTQESNLAFAKKVSSSETSTTLEGLSNGTTYYAAIRAVDASGNKSELSAIRTAMPTVTKGGSLTPTNFTVVAGDKEIRVTWSSARDDIREYVVYWGLSLSDLSQSKRVDKTNQSVTITGLSNGTAYFVAMSAIDITGNESDKTAATTSTPLDSNTQPPSAPKALVVVPGDGKAIVSWSANIEPDLSGYTIYWGTVETSLDQSKRVPATATSAEIIGLSNGTIYYVALSANDTANSESERTKSQPVTPFKPDITAPAIARTTPSDNADITDLITVKFSESGAGSL